MAVVETSAPDASVTTDPGQTGSFENTLEFNWKNVDDSVYSQLVVGSGLGKAGKLITDEISRKIDWSGKVLMDGRKEAAADEDFIDGLAQAMGIKIDDNQSDICKIAALLISNACLLQKRLCSLDKWQAQLIDMSHVARAGLDTIDLLTRSWQTILKQDYKPVFMPALVALQALPRRPFVASVLRKLAECAENVADDLASLGYDHAGPLYHKIMPKAEAKGAFYTNNLSALILAKLTIDKNWIDWHDDQAIKNLKIMDPACGTGTLLMASLKVIKERFMQARQLDLTNLSHQQQLMHLHKILVENVIHGLDINQCAIQLAASNLTLGAPSVDYRKMNLHTLKHGIQADGGTKAGSLEILNENNSDTQLSMDIILSAEAYNTQVDNESLTFPVSDIDLVIMNPPFTNNVKRSSQYSPLNRKKMQKHERNIRDKVLKTNKMAGEAINSNSLATYFIPLADQITSIESGTIARVMATTACISSSGLDERKFLTNRFHIEYILTSHDPKKMNFSENTNIHESLMIGRRYNSLNTDKPTQFISLKRMPGEEEEVNNLIKSIERNADHNKWFSRKLWSKSRMKNGDWSPAQWLNGGLADIALEIQANSNLEKAGFRYKIDPVGQSVRAAFEECSSSDPHAKPLFWSISSKIHNSLNSRPESYRRPKSDKHPLADRLWQNRNHILIAQRYNINGNGLAAVYSQTASIGSGFMPINITGETAKGFTAYWNSTPVMIMLLNLRSKKLTYPSWSQDQLHSITIPKPDNPAWSVLNQAFELIKDKTILPLKDGNECKVRQTIDKAAAQALNISDLKIAKWRSMLAKEPTISNDYAS